MFKAYLWDEPCYGYDSDDPIEVLDVRQDQYEDGPGETYFLIADRKTGRFFRVNMRRFHTCPPLESADPEPQRESYDAGAHIKVQYKDEELTLRQLIDKLDDAARDREHWELLYLSSREEIQALKRQIIKQEERRRT